MEMEKRSKKRKKSDEKKKKVLQILSNAELEEAAAIKQAKSSMMISASDKSQWNPIFFSPNEKRSMLQKRTPGILVPSEMPNSSFTIFIRW